MTETKLKAALPEGTKNGLSGPGWQRTLVDHPRQLRVAIVVYDVASVTQNIDDGSEVPAVRVKAIEPVTDETEERETLAFLQRLSSRRLGDEQLDIPDEPVIKEPGVLEATEVLHFEVRKLPGGKLGLYLLSSTGAELGKRGALVAKELGNPAVGEYVPYDLPEGLRPYGRILMEEWEAQDDPGFEAWGDEFDEVDEEWVEPDD